MAAKIGVKYRRLPVTILWTFAKPYIISGLEPDGLKSLHCSSEAYHSRQRRLLNHEI